MNTCSHIGEHMWINKSTARILQVFAGHITESFTLREVARDLDMHVSLAHRSIQPLIKERILLHDKHKNLQLNYIIHHETLAMAEYLRRDELLSKARLNNVRLFSEELTQKIKEDSFILLLFGSAVTSEKPRDIDVLLIVDENNKIAFHERFMENIASNYDAPFECRVISFEGIKEMISRRDEKNIMNEILNKHIILSGAELFYRLITKWR
jgi:hypothetical protein